MDTLLAPQWLRQPKVITRFVSRIILSVFMSVQFSNPFMEDRQPTPPRFFQRLSIVHFIAKLPNPRAMGPKKFNHVWCPVHHVSGQIGYLSVDRLDHTPLNSHEPLMERLSTNALLLPHRWGHALRKLIITLHLQYSNIPTKYSH